MLHGLRVLDLSAITAGGRTTQLLADFGADVIKIEGPQRADPFRHWSGVTGESGSRDLDSPPFRVVGRNKRGVCIDLKDRRGRDLFRRLVESSALVVENFRRGVMRRLDIDFPVLLSWQPSIVLLSISSQGEDGPESAYASFGGTLEALGGLMSVTGYDAAHPTWSTSKVNYPDQMVSLIAPGLALEALLRARASGRGVHVDLAQRELVVSLLGELIVDASIVSERRPAAPGTRYADEDITLTCPAAGDDEWVCITVTSDAEWTRLLAATGLHALADEPRFHDGASRVANSQALAREVASWSSRIEKTAAAICLQRSGVSAAPVLRAWELPSHDRARGETFHTDVPSNLSEERREQQFAWPVQIEGAGAPRVRRRAPHVGEHTREVLEDIGIPEQEIADLLIEGVIAGPRADPTTRPTASLNGAG